MSDPRRILLVGATTGYQTRSFATAAQRLGIELVLATDRCHVLDDPWGDSAVAVRFEDPENAARILAEDGGVRGIVALGDRPAYLAAVAARRMGIRYNSPESVMACRNKYLAHQRFRDAGLLVPEFVRISAAADPGEYASATPYPCVLKPLGLSASRGVIRADDPAQFAAAFRRIADLLALPEIARLHDDEDRFIQVESFIPGKEFALEGILIDGRLRLLALFDKPDPLDGPYFEETIYVTPSREQPDEQREIVRVTESAIAALGLEHGPIHAEMRVNDRGVWMLEVAARPIGGLCARVLPGLEDLILRHAAGDATGGVDLGAEAAGVMMIPIPRGGIYVSVAGIEEAKEVPGIEDVIVTAKEGQKLVPAPEGSSYLGFVFARGVSPGMVEDALRTAHGRLRFEIATALPLVRD